MGFFKYGENSVIGGPMSLPSVLFLKEHGKQKQDTEHDDKDQNKDGRQDVFTQVPHITEISTAYENSLCGAYRAILADISREINELQEELKNGSSIDHNTISVKRGKICLMIRWKDKETTNKKR